MIKNQTPLSAARKFEREASKQISEKDRPLIHLTPMVGWMNDPNGFCYYQDEYQKAVRFAEQMEQAKREERRAG